MPHPLSSLFLLALCPHRLSRRWLSGPMQILVKVRVRRGLEIQPDRATVPWICTFPGCLPPSHLLAGTPLCAGNVESVGSDAPNVPPHTQMFTLTGATPLTPSQMFTLIWGAKKISYIKRLNCYWCVDRWCRDLWYGGDWALCPSWHAAPHPPPPHSSINAYQGTQSLQPASPPSRPGSSCAMSCLPPSPSALSPSRRSSCGWI